MGSFLIMEEKEILHTTLVTGCSGLVGYHVVKQLYENIREGELIVGVDIKEPPYDYKKMFGDAFVFHNIDLRDYYKTSALFELYNVNDLINCFGIKGTPKTAKERPVDFLEPSISVNLNLIKNCQHHSVYICFLSSVGVYASAEEFHEDDMWEALPSKHDWYPAWSKRIPELLLDAYRLQFGFMNWTVLRPSNIFGEYDNFGENAMAIPATIRKVYESDGEIEAWGDGSPIRDYVYAGDVAAAALRACRNRLHEEVVNVGSGVETTIKEMVDTIIEVSGKDIKVVWDKSKPNGEPKRKMNTEKQEQYGLLPKFGFKEGIKRTYEHFKKIKENE